MKDSSNIQSTTDEYGKKTRHGVMNLYRHMLPLASIFLLDLLPSRCSLLMAGHLSASPVAFDSIFMAYAFTNFCSVFVLSLSCGLDTLSKAQLENIYFLRCALCVVAVGAIPYFVCVGWSESILRGVNSSPEIIESTSRCIQLLTVYAVCYIVFAMIRKALLQYLHTALLIGLMFARFCLHLMTGYALYLYSDLGVDAFLISDSVSMAVLLIVTVIMLSQQMKHSGQFIANLFFCCSSTTNSDLEESKRSIMTAGTKAVEPQQVEVPNVVGGGGGGNGGGHYLREYVAATMIPGAISCLEWWAIEAFSFLVGALSYGDDAQSKLTVVLTHSIWNSFLLLFEMPMLGLSVAMAAIITADIRTGKFYAAWYTFLQSMATATAYCVLMALVVMLAFDKMVYVFFPVNSLGTKFEEEVMANSSSITIMAVIAISGYSFAMCFLGMFVSVGRLARGGSFMLIGYYAFGVVLAVILGFVAEWKFYGIWFGFAGAFLVWCLLSAAYWLCTDWFLEMKTMAQAYEVAERKEHRQHRHSKRRPPTYGATQ